MRPAGIAGCFGVPPRTLRECYKSVTRALQESYKRVTRVLLECYKSVTNLMLPKADCGEVRPKSEETTRLAVRGVFVDTGV
jgi:O-acetyl-ADP-ribose deacetylase (regulator of RNase III)